MKRVLRAAIREIFYMALAFAAGMVFLGGIEEFAAMLRMAGVTITGLPW